jgi:RNA polymerase sigma-70 factor (ECF subfamily)
MDDGALRQQVAGLHLKHGALVLRRCRSLLQDPSAAEDAAQEVFLRVMENLEGFRGESSPVSWIYRIATNICLDELRRKARRNTVELTPELQEMLVASGSAEETMARRQEIMRWFRRTSTASLQIWVHAYMDEMTQEEIADTMGLSRKTVWTKLQQLRRQLKMRDK